MESAREPRRGTRRTAFDQQVQVRDAAKPKEASKTQKRRTKLLPEGAGRASVNHGSKERRLEQNMQKLRAVRSVLKANKELSAKQIAQQEDELVVGRLRKKSIFASAAANIGISTLILEGEIAQTPVLKTCTSSFISRLAKDTATASFQDGQRIYEHGQAGDTMLIVLRGQISVAMGGHKIRTLDKGDHIGEAMMLGLHDAWPVTLTAEAASMVCEIGKEAFMHVLNLFPEESAIFETMLHADPEITTVGLQTRVCELFKDLSGEIIDAMDHIMPRRIFFPGEMVLNDAPGSCELVLLVEGSAAVDIAGRVVRVESRGEEDELEVPDLFAVRGLDAEDDEDEEEPETLGKPAAFGELEFLGLTTARTIAVKAQTVCYCRVFHREMLLDLLMRHGEDMKDTLLGQMVRHNNPASTAPALANPEGRMHSRFFGGTSVLQDFIDAGCSEEFLEFLEGNLESRLYPKNKMICDLYTKSGKRSLQMLMSGEATVEDGQGQRPLHIGEVFGRMASLGLNPKPLGATSVVAAEHCCIQVLHQITVVRALELFQENRKNILMLDHDHLKKGKNGKSADFAAMLQNSQFFCNMHPGFVEELGNAAIDRIFMPGDLIVHEGDSGHSMFILVHGNAEVFMTEREGVKVKAQPKKPVLKRRNTKHMSRVGVLSPGGICGELAMLGITQTRSASIQASTLCVLWEVTQDRALQILDRYPEERSLFGGVIVQNLDLSVPGRLLGLPIFSPFDRKFRMLLTLYAKRSAYFPEHVIVREGEIGDKLIILNLGPAMLEKRGFTVKMFSPGSIFGADHMLGINRSYCGTLIAMSVCHALSVERSSYLLALEQYPSKTQHLELLRTQRIESAQLREAVDRLAIRKSIWQRYQGQMDQSERPVFTDDEDQLRKTTKAWYDYVQEVRRHKQDVIKQQKEMDEKIAQWKAKQQVGQRKADKKKREKELLQANITERGPLQYLDDMEEPSGQNGALPPVKSLALPLLPTVQNKQLVSVLKAWPSPRPSPHYNLKVWGVMGDEILQEGQGQQTSQLLPLITSPRKAAVHTDESKQSKHGENGTAGPGDSGESSASEQEKEVAEPAPVSKMSGVARRKFLLDAAKRAIASGLA